VIDILTGTWRAQALYAAAALGLPDHVAHGYVSPASLALEARADEESLRRLMRLLVVLGLFEADDVGSPVYRLTPAGELLRGDVPGSLRDMCLIYGEEFHRAWGSVVPAVRSGGTGFAEVFGMPLADYLRDVPGAGAKFQAAMSAGGAVFDEFSRLADLSSSDTVVDVGGGSGTLLSAVLRDHPRLRGVLFDLPSVVERAGEVLGSVFPPERTSVVAGDVFDAVPEGADTYMLSRVLQDWGEKECSKILTNCRRAMSEGSRLLVLERVVDIDRSSVLPVMWDVHLMMVAGGRERTIDEYRSLFQDSGFRLEQCVPLPLENSLLVASPTP